MEPHLVKVVYVARVITQANLPVYDICHALISYIGIITIAIDIVVIIILVLLMLIIIILSVIILINSIVLVHLAILPASIILKGELGSKVQVLSS